MQSKNVALSFLGLGPRDGYGLTRYQFENGSCETSLMPHAVNEVIQPDELIVVGTEESNAKYREALSKNCSFTSLKVPSGRSEKEWWQVFDTITDAIPENANLTIDITHGFRSLPVIALSIALYLEAARNVNVAGILYAPYNRQAPETTPVIDLTPFLDMIEWSVAARQFVRDGNADVLASMMIEAQNEAHKRGDPNPPRQIKSAGKQLKTFTDALSVVRAEEVTAERVETLVDTLDAIQDEVDERPRLRPLDALLEQVKVRVRPMQTTNLYDARGFAAQAEMMHFFLDTNQVQQAVTLAREALISHKAVEMGLDPAPVVRDVWEGSGRDRAREALVELASDSKREGEAKMLGDLWSKLGEVRNDINHAGMRVNPVEGKKLASAAQNVVEEVTTHITSSST